MSSIPIYEGSDIYDGMLGGGIAPMHDRESIPQLDHHRAHRDAVDVTGELAVTASIYDSDGQDETFEM